MQKKTINSNMAIKIRRIIAFILFVFSIFHFFNLFKRFSITPSSLMAIHVNIAIKIHDIVVNTSIFLTSNLFRGESSPFRWTKPKHLYSLVHLYYLCLSGEDSSSPPIRSRCIKTFWFKLGH